MVCNDITRRDAILDTPLRTVLQWVTIRLEEKMSYQRLLASMFGGEQEE